MPTSSEQVNRQWLLASRPDGQVTPKNFEYRELPFVVPELARGEVLLHNKMFTCAPVMRNFLNAPSHKSRISVSVGSPIIGPVGSEVIASNNPDFPVGAAVETVARWEDYSVVNPVAGPPVYKAGRDMSLMDIMGPLSQNTMTAYFGLIDVGQPHEGDTVVVSGAAGSVGMMACQFAKLHGCRVIGIAGGKQKCDWLVDVLKVNHAIDYKAEDCSQRLSELCPEGVNVYFDNVGGEITQAVIDNIAPHARIAVCGQIASYQGGSAPGPRDMMKIVYWRVRIEGFTIADWADEMAAGREKIHALFSEGKLVSREDIRHGFKSLPDVFPELFAGTNNGSLIVTSE